MYRFGLLVASFLFCTCALIACKGGGLPDPGIIDDGGAAAWGMAGGGPMRQGRSAYAGPTTPDVAWEYVMDGELEDDPVFVTDSLICVSARYAVLAFDLSGQLLWRYVAAHGIVDQPYAAADGSVMVACYEGTIARLEADGTPRWETTIPDARQIRSRAFAPDGSTYMWVELVQGRQVIALDPDGAVKWSLDTDGSYTMYEAAHGLLFCLTSDADLAVYDQDGTLRWELPESADTSTHFVGSTPGGDAIVETVYREDLIRMELQAFDLAGTELWAYPLEAYHRDFLLVDQAGNTYVPVRDSNLMVVTPSGAVHTTPDAGYLPVGMDSDGQVYAVAPGVSLHALNDRGESIEQWSLPTYYGKGAISGRGYVAVTGHTAGTDAYADGLHLFSFTGDHLWGYPNGDEFVHSMLLDAEGNCAFASDDILVTLDADGKPAQPVAGEDWIGDSLAIGPQGHLYCCDYQHRLQALTWDGETVWDALMGGEGHPHDIATTDAGFYIPSDFLLYMLDPDGERRYAFVAHSSLDGGAAIGPDGTAYFMDNDKRCYAIAPDGTQRWRVETDEKTYWRHPVVAGENQILFPAAGGLVALDADGQERWRFQLDDCAADTAPAVAADGSIYLPLHRSATSWPGGGTQPGGGTPTGGGVPADPYASVSASPMGSTPVEVSAVPDELELPGLCALSAGGEFEWFHPLPDAVPTFAQPVVDRDGRVYVLTDDEMVHALSPDSSELWSLELRPFRVGSATGLAISPQGRLIVMRGAVITAIGP